MNGTTHPLSRTRADPVAGHGTAWGMVLWGGRGARDLLMSVHSSAGARLTTRAGALAKALVKPQTRARATDTTEIVGAGPTLGIAAYLMLMVPRPATAVTPD